jgi:hypothetical protein
VGSGAIRDSIALYCGALFNNIAHFVCWHSSVACVQFFGMELVKKFSGRGFTPVPH